MANTPTSNFGYNKPAIGDENWGSTIDNNWDMVDADLIVEHKSDGTHGPKVTISQSTADSALTISKTHTGSDNIIEITNSGSGNDIVGNSNNWHVDKNGNATFNSVNVGNPTGTVLAFAASSTPSGYLLCDGSAVSRSTYSDLFTAIGTTWGAGDGSTTFNVPDLRGTFLRGIGTHGTGTKSNGGSYSGPTLGSSDNDQMQGFEIAEDYRTGTLASATNNNTFVMDDNRSSAGSTAFVPKTDGVNGTPRTGDETKPFNVGVNYIIKY